MSLISWLEETLLKLLLFITAWILKWFAFETKDSSDCKVFNKDFDTNLLSTRITHSDSSLMGNDNTEVYDKFDSRTFKKPAPFVTQDLSRPADTPEEYHDASPTTEVAAVSPDSPVDNLSRASAACLPAARQPNPEPSPRLPPKQRHQQAAVSHSNGMSNEVKEQNTNQSSFYTDSDVQALVESARKDERQKWATERRQLQDSADSQSTEIVSLKKEKTEISDMSNGTAIGQPLTDPNMDTKVMLAIPKEYQETLLASRKRGDEILLKQVKKLSADNSEILKEMDVMHSAMSDLHKRYDKARAIINQMKKREDALEEQIRELQSELKASEDNCRFISKSCDDQLDGANNRMELLKIDTEKEKLMMEASIKRLELEVKSWHSKFIDKESSEQELIAICDSLMGVKDREEADQS